MLRAGGTLIVVDSCGVRTGRASVWCGLQRLVVTVLLRSLNVVVVPDLLEDSAVHSASKVRGGSRLGCESTLDLSERVCGGVRRDNASCSEHIKGGVHSKGTNHSVEEVDNFLVLLISRVACSVEGRCAGCVLGELVAPEVNIGSTLVNPVLLHVVQEVVTTELFNEGVDTRSSVVLDNRAIVGLGTERSGIILPLCRQAFTRHSYQARDHGWSSCLWGAADPPFPTQSMCSRTGSARRDLQV